MELSTPITSLQRIGTVTARNLSKLGFETVADILFYFPFRYEDFSQSLTIAELAVGQTANISGQVELIQNKRSPRKRMYITEALINDGTESLRVIWFNQPFLTRTLKSGDMISLSGRVTEDYGGLVMTSPVYEKLIGKAIHTQGIVPVYHTTYAVTQKQLRSAIAQVVPLASQVSDWLPSEIVKANTLETLSEAIKQIHFPEDAEKLKRAKERLGFNELFLVQLRAQHQRRKLLRYTAPVAAFAKDETKTFVTGLPFDLTDDQKKTAWEIIQDLGQAKPMVRLLQGDVGSGKTVVACLAMLNVFLAGKQSALMVPTEILARQHFETLSSSFFAKQPIGIALLTANYHLIRHRAGTIEEASKAKAIQAISSGEVEIVIGTHALIQQAVDFKDLAFVVIDEQHRFGVDQRSRLVAKVGGEERMPHLLSMTATPIPRSLALALYGDLDISVIKQLPAGRKKIQTRIIEEKQREEMYQFIETELEAGRQAFVICPLIEESDKLGFKSVTAEHERLDTTVFKKQTIGLLHGRLKPKERETVMADFAANKIQLLVATSVIEIGIDIPNASVMLVEDADRFGLAQLHQYRGRVGRSDMQSYCFLASRSTEPRSLARLEAMTKYDSGFDLAQADLAFRGPGEVYGLEQKGFPELKMANFYDVAMIKKARDAALNLLEIDPELANQPKLRQELGEWEERAHLE